MTEEFVIEGDLQLDWTDCGTDAFMINGLGLDDIIARHFDIERIMPSGDRHIGKVRITVEKLE